MTLQSRTYLHQHTAVAIISLLFLVTGLLRLNDLSLYPDSTWYLIWGSSLAQGNGFVDNTQPLPERNTVNAPLYAVILAPVLAFFPLSLTAAKTWTLMWGVTALVLFYIWLSRSLRKLLAISGTLLLAVNPLFLVISTEVLSEAVFIVVMLLVMLLLDRFVTQDEKKTTPAIWLCLALLSTIMLLREIGFALMMAAFVTLVSSKRPRHAFTLLLLSLLLYSLWQFRNVVVMGESSSIQSSNISFIVEHVVTSPDRPFFEELLARIRLNGAGYATLMGGMLFYPIPTHLIVQPSAALHTITMLLELLTPVVVIAATTFTLIGVAIDIRRNATGFLRALFILLYLLILFTYPFHDIRFLLPLVPFVLFYFLTGTQSASLWKPLEFFRRRIFGVLLVVLIATPNIVALTDIVRTNLAYRDSPTRFYDSMKASGEIKKHFATPWQRAGEYIAEHAPPDAVIATSAKEIVPFIGERKLLEVSSDIPVTQFEVMLRDNAVTHVIAPFLWSDFRSCEFPMSESRLFAFEAAWDVGSVRIFAVRSRFRSITTTADTIVDTFDTSRASELLRLSRHLIMNRQYPEAISFLTRAIHLQPSEPQLSYHLFLAYVLLRDEQNASHAYNHLFTVPHSTRYIAQAHTLLDALNRLETAHRSTRPHQTVLTTLDVAQQYWNLGYRAEGYHLARNVVAKDTAFFVGLLWNWHYAIQMRDTALAAHYLGILERIDAENPVVQSFRTMTRLSRTLRRTRAPGERSSVRLTIAKEYERIELFEDALTEAERAIGEDPSNVRAWLYVGTLFERKNKPLGARQAFRQVLAIDPENPDARKKLTALNPFLN